MKTLHKHPSGCGYGWRLPRHPINRFPLYVEHIDVEALPSRVDLRPDNPPIYDQQSWGSCTGNAWARVAEYEMKSHKMADFMPSRMAIYYWERELEGDTADDTGASLQDGAIVMAKKGAPHESLWPYDQSHFSAKPTPEVEADGLNHQLLQVLQVRQSLAAMKAVLANRQLIAIGFTVFESFESAHVQNTGIVPMPRKSEQALGGHAVAVVGYNNSVSRFICANSWGTGWGQSGYFEIPFAYIVNFRLAADFWTCSAIESP